MKSCVMGTVNPSAVPVVIVRLNAFVEDKLLAPVTCTVKLAVVAVVGVPVTMPLPLRFNPGGRLPEYRDHEYGAVPPVAVRVWL
jgi:hypothetical protein